MKTYNELFKEDILYTDTDPEYSEILKNFVFDEVPSFQYRLDEKNKYICILATLLGCQGKELFEKMIPVALQFVTPVEIKEVIYQGTDYLGLGRVYPFVEIANTVFEKEGISLPLEAQGTVSKDTRLIAGNQKQIEYFGPQMKETWLKPGDSAHINKWLADNCFGDYYTRKGLSDAQREMITFCFLAAQGGCEPQLTGHAMANMGLGNDKEFLIEVISQNLPYIGYPRSLNALTCVNNAYKQIVGK